MEISKEELRSLRVKAGRFDEIERLITGKVISIYIQPGVNFDYGDSEFEISNFVNSVSGLDKFNDANGLNALTNHPRLIERMIRNNAIEETSRAKSERLNLNAANKSNKDPIVNIYLMKNTRNGYVKIGMTSGEPKYRETTLQSQEPEVELMFSFKGRRSLEGDLHSEFSDKRLRGEWFNLSDEDVISIKDRINA